MVLILIRCGGKSFLPTTVVIIRHIRKLNTVTCMHFATYNEPPTFFHRGEFLGFYIMLIQ